MIFLTGLFTRPNMADADFVGQWLLTNLIISLICPQTYPHSSVSSDVSQYLPETEELRSYLGLLSWISLYTCKLIKH